MNKQQKLFAFKLSNKQKPQPETKKWSAREGLAAAGCTDPSDRDIVRYSDFGIFC